LKTAGRNPGGQQHPNVLFGKVEFFGEELGEAATYLDGGAIRAGIPPPAHGYRI